MLRKAKDVMDFTLGAQDGEIGRVKDFYFDDEAWTVRYLVADTGKWLALKRVLISPFAVQGFRDRDKVVEINLTRDQVKGSPSIEENAPVSRQYELEYLQYYGWPFYWQGPGLWGPWTEPVYRDYPVPGPEAPAPAESEPQDDLHLRSTGEVTGYHLEARDGEIGHVADFIIDDADWAIQYLVIDTGHWWPGRKVLLSPVWSTSVDWDRSQVRVDLDRATIKLAPVYDPSIPITREYEARLFAYYSQPPYWERRLAA